MLKKVNTSIISEINSNSNCNVIEVDKNLVIILEETELIIKYLSFNKKQSSKKILFKLIKRYSVLL